MSRWCVFLFGGNVRSPNYKLLVMIREMTIQSDLRELKPLGLLEEKCLFYYIQSRLIHGRQLARLLWLM